MNALAYWSLQVPLGGQALCGVVFVCWVAPISKLETDFAEKRRKLQPFVAGKGQHSRHISYLKKKTSRKWQWKTDDVDGAAVPVLVLLMGGEKKNMGKDSTIR